MIRVGSVKVNGIGDGGFIGIGPNLISGADTRLKWTVGHASVRGDQAMVVTLRGTINDADLVDTPIWSISCGPDEGTQGMEG